MSKHEKLETTKEALAEKLEPFNQLHILAFWEELTNVQRAVLAAQIDSLDLGLIEELSKERGPVAEASNAGANVGAPPAVRLGSIDDAAAAEARQRGEQLLGDGQVGAVLVAGGQGTRLGFPHPKGMYPIGPLSGASLFQIHMEKILARSRNCGSTIPIYLMTSSATHDETGEYLKQNNYFGVRKEDVFIFCQGSMPAVDATNGRLLLEDRGALIESPDGHGGIIAALANSGAMEDMSRRGIRHLFYFQVDNSLVTVCNPEMLGHHQQHNSEYTLQVVAKSSPLEKVGNVVEADGKVRIIEYSDLPDNLAQKTSSDGSLKLWAGSIAVHVLNVAFLQRMANDKSALPYHRAMKKVSYLDPADGTIKPDKPDKPNAVKFERFIFDILPHANRALAIEVDRTVAFAPLKNASGELTATPEIVHNQLMSLHRRWLERAGAQIKDNLQIEISPLFALDQQELSQKVRPGTLVEVDTYFH